MLDVNVVDVVIEAVKEVQPIVVAVDFGQLLVVLALLFAVVLAIMIASLHIADRIKELNQDIKNESDYINKRLDRIEDRINTTNN